MTLILFLVVITILAVILSLYKEICCFIVFATLIKADFDGVHALIISLVLYVIILIVGKFNDRSEKS